MKLLLFLLFFTTAAYSSIQFSFFERNQSQAGWGTQAKDLLCTTSRIMRAATRETINDYNSPPLVDAPIEYKCCVLPCLCPFIMGIELCQECTKHSNYATGQKKQISKSQRQSKRTESQNTCSLIATYALCPILCPIALAKSAIKEQCPQVLPFCQQEVYISNTPLQQSFKAPVRQTMH